MSMELVCAHPVFHSCPKNLVDFLICDKYVLAVSPIMEKRTKIRSLNWPIMQLSGAVPKKDVHRAAWAIAWPAGCHHTVHSRGEQSGVVMTNRSYGQSVDPQEETRQPAKPKAKLRNPRVIQDQGWGRHTADVDRDRTENPGLSWNAGPGQRGYGDVPGEADLGDWGWSVGSGSQQSVTSVAEKTSHFTIPLSPFSMLWLPILVLDEPC